MWIYLQELAKSKNCEGIVQDAIIFGAPVSGHAKDWAPLQKVVSGRIINGYCGYINVDCCIDSLYVLETESTQNVFFFLYF